jgi:hypothetical protein
MKSLSRWSASRDRQVLLTRSKFEADFLPTLYTNDSRIRDAKIVMKLRDEIIKSDHPRFVAAHGSTQDLQDIKFKNAEVVFITTSSGQGLRVEAEIDRVYECGTLGYQIGSVHLYRYEKSDKVRTTGRNKLIQMTTIDIEK